MSERGAPSTASTLSLVLLRDVRAVFDLVDSDRISSADMVRFLLDGNDVWADVDGRPLDQRSLAQLLQAWQVAPEKIRFQHKLEGFEADWVEGGSERRVPYGRLPYGQYVFRVKADLNLVK